MKTLRQLIGQIKLRYFGFLIVYILLACGLSISDVLITRTTGSISDAAISSSTEALLSILLWMGAFTAAKLIFDALNTWLSGRMKGRADYTLRDYFARHMTRIGLKTLQGKASGDILALYTSDLSHAVALITQDLLEIVSSATLLIASAVFMARINPWITLVFFLCFPILTLMQVKISEPIAPLVQNCSEQRGVFNGVVNDCLQNTALVMSYGLQEDMESRYLAAYVGYERAWRKRSLVFIILVVAGMLMSFLPIIFVAVSASLQVIGGAMTIGTFIVYFALSNSANEGLQMLSQRMSNLQTQLASTRRVLGAVSDEAEPSKGQVVLAQPAAGDAAVQLTDICFSYIENQPVLNDVCLTIPVDARVAFVGESGCGKSTLAKLILGLYAPDEGAINWLSNPNIEPRDARQCVAYVPQDSYLFAQSIAENIRCGAADRGTDALWEALRMAGLESFVRGLPGQLDAQIEENGDNLSGGQRQRLALARALYRQAPILLLDEATSALDPATEQSVLDRLKSADRQQTVLMVAHRLAAVAFCDMIYLMEKGRIVECGDYQTLMQPDTKFHALYERQQKEEETCKQPK